MGLGIGKVCWKGMSEMREVCGKKRERCNVAMEKAKIGAEMMQKVLGEHLARLCESFLKV